jgi:hypothetical protein
VSGLLFCGFGNDIFNSTTKTTTFCSMQPNNTIVAMMSRLGVPIHQELEHTTSKNMDDNSDTMMTHRTAKSVIYDD